MIQTVLNLGVKGADLVINQLQKIQENKEKFARPATVTIDQTGQPTQPNRPSPNKETPKEAKQSTVFKGILDAVKSSKDILNKTFGKKPKEPEAKKDEESKPKETKEEGEKKKSSESLQELGQSAKGAVQALASLSAGNALKGAIGLANAIPFVGTGIALAGQSIISAAEAFRANVENASRINFDTAEAGSRISNIIQGSGGGNFTGRVDLDVNSQRALAEALGEKYGVVQKPLQEAIKELYRSDNGRAVDVNQAQALAQGQFSALGTDKGFFLQKIGDQLQGLPPSMRQAMTASLLENVKKEEQFKETSTGARSAVTQFDTEQRDRARDIATAPSAVENALAITRTLNTIDATLNGGFNSMINTLNALSTAIRTQSVRPLLNITNENSSRIGRP